MTPFPVASSIPAPAALGTEVTRRYDLGGAVRCALLAHTSNDSYAVEAPRGRFVLRVYAPSRTAAEVGYEVELLRHLARRGVAAAVPLPARSGRHVWSVRAPEGARRCVLFARAPGEPPGEPHPSAAFGRVVADVHAALDGFTSRHARPPIDRELLLDRPLAALRPWLSHRPDALALLDGAAGTLARRLAALSPELDAGAIHGDVHGGQGHVAAAGTVTLFDFDDCGYGWRAYDLAGFRWWQRFNGRAESLWGEFLAGYRERRALAEADLAAVPTFVALRHVWLLGLTVRSAERFGGWWADDRFFDRRLGQLADWLATG